MSFTEMRHAPVAAIRSTFAFLCAFASSRSNACIVAKVLTARKRWVFLSLIILAATTTIAQKNDVYVDKQGVMRWGDTKKEVMGFGVNYTTPFAHAYRTAVKLGVDVEKAIDEDVYHFARLGFDAYRVHVWDTEISDSLGNLLDNEHLRLFDYLLMRLQERGIRAVITPIAFWGNGWPEPDDPTPGFSNKYGKADCLTNEAAIKAQENYLFQFLNHVNRYTGVAYKNDPMIVAFEVSNEPHHRESPDKVTTFINRMTTAMRKSGCRKPIFYNVSHSVHLGKAYYAAGIQGGTFQWYPTGLGSRHELRGNFLPNVDRYTMPFADAPAFRKRAKIVYEFDAADVGRSYIYPAMARSFRTAGIQWATHFAYDPTFMAHVNTEYNTHYMNLAYAPQKALSLKLAAEVFHQVPMYKDYGSYPANSRFEGFHVSYEKDLSEFVNEKKLIYTNDTETRPASPEMLEELAGSGSSPVVAYKGTGAYFLDRIQPGVWRLEVMPDALWVDNLFGRNSPRKVVAVVQWNAWPMQLNVLDLGTDFSVTAINEGNVASVAVTGNEFTITPGTYLVTRKGVTTHVKPADKFKNIRLNEFVAPPSRITKNYVVHEPARSVTEGSEMKIRATVATPMPNPKVSVHYYSGFRAETLPMTQVKPGLFEATIPSEKVVTGYFRYFLIVESGNSRATYPEGVEGSPNDWDFFADKTYEVPVVRAGSPITLFDAGRDSEEMSREWRRGSQLVPLDDAGTAELQIRIEKLFVPDPEDANKEKNYDYSMRYNFRKQILGRGSDLQKATTLVLNGRSLNTGPLTIQVALITREGNTYGALLTLNNEHKDYELSISQLKPVKMVTLPRPYPTFLDYYFEGGTQKPLVLADVETIQLSVGPGLTGAELENAQAFAIQSIQVR